jgi:hypothetical protein
MNRFDEFLLPIPNLNHHIEKNIIGQNLENNSRFFYGLQMMSINIDIILSCRTNNISALSLVQPGT